MCSVSQWAFLMQFVFIPFHMDVNIDLDLSWGVTKCYLLIWSNELVFSIIQKVFLFAIHYSYIC